MEIRTVHTQNAAPPAGHYSQAVVYNGLAVSQAEREAANVVGKEVNLTLKDLFGAEQSLGALKGRICDALGCEPGELLVRVPASGKQRIEAANLKATTKVKKR